MHFLCRTLLIQLIQRLSFKYLQTDFKWFPVESWNKYIVFLYSVWLNVTYICIYYICIRWQTNIGNVLECQLIQLFNYFYFYKAVWFLERPKWHIIVRKLIWWLRWVNASVSHASFAVVLSEEIHVIKRRDSPKEIRNSFILQLLKTTLYRFFNKP